MSERDTDRYPYSPDEARVARWFFDKGIGGGDDPIGSLIASHEVLAAERKQLRAQVEDARKQAFSEAMDELDKLRTLAATDFKSPNCQGQRGMDRTDAFYDAYHAIRRLSDTSTVGEAK